MVDGDIVHLFDSRGKSISLHRDVEQRPKMKLERETEEGEREIEKAKWEGIENGKKINPQMRLNDTQ